MSFDVQSETAKSRVICCYSLREEKRGSSREWVHTSVCQTCDNHLCCNAEQTQRILQDVLVAEEAERVGAQRDPSNVSVTEEQRVRLFHKYVNVLSVFATFKTSRLSTFHLPSSPTSSSPSPPLPPPLRILIPLCSSAPYNEFC